MTPSGPTVSVVIPTYDRLGMLREAVASVRAQTFEDWELIVVDDGSTDGTVGWVWGHEERRMRLVTLEHGGNPARTRNAGIQESRGKWIAFLDSDDLWTSDKLERQIRKVSAAAGRWSYTAIELIDEGGDVIPIRAGSPRVESGWILEEVVETTIGVAISSLMVERELLLHLSGFDEDPKLLFREDYDLALRLAEIDFAVAVAQPLALVRHHARRSTDQVGDVYAPTIHAYRKLLKRTSRTRIVAAARARIRHHRRTRLRTRILGLYERLAGFVRSGDD